MYAIRSYYVTSLTRCATEAAASFPSTAIIFLVAIQLPPLWSMMSRLSLHDVGQLCREGLHPPKSRTDARIAAVGTSYNFV